jgi:hypothetical protein
VFHRRARNVGGLRVMVVALALGACAADAREFSDELVDAGGRVEAGTHDAAGGASPGSGGSSQTGGGAGAGGGSVEEDGSPGPTGGAPGTGGQAGAGGLGGSAAGGGSGTGGAVDTGPPCVPTGSESCANGLDDDCNGDTDCADQACASAPSCQALPENTILGARIAAGGTCPAGYTGGVTHIHKDVDQGSCTGCGCSVAATVCETSITAFSSQNDCVANSGGVLEYGGGPLSTNGNPCRPFSDTLTDPSWFRSDPLRITLPDCKASGSAQKKGASFKTSADFCTLPAGTNPPSASTAKTCALIKGATACPSGYGTPDSNWYGSLSDNRTCTACSCSINTYGDCNSVKIAVWTGDNYLADVCMYAAGPDATFNIGDRDCSVDGHYVPSYNLTGSPKKSTCSGHTGFSGSGGITLQDRYTLCCP